MAPTQTPAAATGLPEPLAARPQPPDAYFGAPEHAPGAAAVRHTGVPTWEPLAEDDHEGMISRARTIMSLPAAASDTTMEEELAKELGRLETYRLKKDKVDTRVVHKTIVCRPAFSDVECFLAPLPPRTLVTMPRDKPAMRDELVTKYGCEPLPVAHLANNSHLPEQLARRGAGNVCARPRRAPRNAHVHERRELVFPRRASRHAAFYSSRRAFDHTFQVPVEDWTEEDYQSAIDNLETRLAYLKRRRDLLDDDCGRTDARRAALERRAPEPDDVRLATPPAAGLGAGGGRAQARQGRRGRRRTATENLGRVARARRGHPRLPQAPEPSVTGGPSTRV